MVKRTVRKEMISYCVQYRITGVQLAVNVLLL